MDAYDGYPSRLSVACSELLSRVQNQTYAMDAYFLESVIDRIFNDPEIDLLTVLSPAITEFGEEYDQVIELVGTKSVAFKLLLESNNDMFEFFMTSFCQHLERSFCAFPLRTVESSAYMALLADYVCFMMPINDKNPPEAKEIRSENAMKSGYSTPLNLFKEEALRRYALSPSSHSMRTLRTITQSISPHFLTFICILVRSYCSLSNWPSDYRFMALRFVLKEIHEFSLAESEDFNLSQLKLQLEWNAPFADELFDFFQSLFSRWPPNSSFNNLFDVWITWIRPWRYCENDLQRVMPFIRSNRRYYIDLSETFWQRSFPLECAQDVDNLALYIAILTSPDMLEVYNSLEYNIEHNVLNLMESLHAFAENLHLKVLEGEYRLQKANWLQRLFFCAEEEMVLSEQKKALEGLDKLVSSANLAVVDRAHYEPRVNIESTPKSSTSWGSSPGSAKQMPDHYVDPATKLMYLTPLGRRQVGRGTHRFDYSKCTEATPPIIASLRSDEIWWLSRLLYRLSRAINRTEFVQYLSRCYEDFTLTGFIARLLLDPEYPRVCVPAHSSVVAFQKPCINLRYFARYRVLIPFCLFFALLYFFPFSYCLVTLLCMLLYARFLT